MSDVSTEIAEFMGELTFPQFAREFIKIEDMDGNIVPFELNEPQQILWTEIKRQAKAKRPVRVLVLKGRQQGMSTVSQALLFWRCMVQPGTKAITVGHVLSATHDLYRKFDRAWIGLREHDLSKAGMQIQPPKGEGGEVNRRINFADPLRSTYRADSATDPEGIGRGGTFQIAHFTEVPQWTKPDETMQAALATVHDKPGTMVIVETTAKGASGWFYEQWVLAMRKIARGEEPDFVPVFVPWHKTAHYRRDLRPGEEPMTASEREWAEIHGLEPEQVYWYRDKRERYGARVTEEYPSTWREAFLSSGEGFFRPEALEHYKEHRRKPDRKGTFKVRKARGGRVALFDERGSKATHIFAQPVKGHSYTVGVDFASGRAKDSSAIVVIDKDERSVVATHQSKMLPDDVLAEAVLLARTYNEALIVPERSGIGQSLVDRLVNEIGYRPVYRETDPIAVRHHRGRRWGWATSNSTREGLLEDMAFEIHSHNIDIPCGRIVEEMGTFIFTDSQGSRAEAAEGYHDDLIMALAIAIRGFGSKIRRKNNYKRDRRTPAVSKTTGY